METREARRSRGEIETLPSGALRVRVYGGSDPITGKSYRRSEVVPAGPGARKEAERVRTRLLSEVDQGRNPRTSATVGQLLDRYMELLTVEPTTRRAYENMIRIHIRPLLGALRLDRIGGEVLDSFYAQLLTCRTHCRGQPLTDHRTDAQHECDHRCVPHACRPLSAASVRHAHVLLNGAFGRAVRWGWLGVNPVQQAQAPALRAPDPQPPSPTQAARIALDAWKDPEWGMFVWLAMTTGARRGELCAFRWCRMDLSAGVIDIRGSIIQSGGELREKDTKTHQRRRLVLDAQTVALLAAYQHHTQQAAAGAGLELGDDAFVFSRAPDGSTPLKPDSVTQRYSRMCRRLGWTMHLHQLRHYSATELIASGVDIRTVAGRLGHGGGGTTTLRVYTAWVAEADQRAAKSLAGRMPELPVGPTSAAGVLALPAAPEPADDEASPYRAIAADLRAAIRCGALRPGDVLPTVKELAARYGVAVGTAHRAVAQLTEADQATASRGKRAVVAEQSAT